MSDFFKKVKSKCKGCLIKTKKSSDCIVYKELDNPWIVKEGNRILLVLENPLESKLDKKHYDNLISYFSKLSEPVDIIVGMECETISGFIPSPMNAIYNSCNTIPTNIDYDVIITIGKAIYSITKTDDILSWEEFTEFNFNPTYFYTSFHFEKNIRVYPFPYMTSFLGKDNFENFYANKQVLSIKRYLKENKIDSKEKPKYEIVKVEDPNKFLIENSKPGIVASDSETSGFHMFNKDFKIKCITLSFDGKTGYYLDFKLIDKAILSEFFKHKHQIWANGKFDCKVLKSQGIENVKIDDDVVLLFHMLNTERMKNGLKSLAWLLGFGNYDRALEEYLDKYKTKDYYNMPESILMPYATIDAIVTYRLYILGKRLIRKQMGLWQAYQIIIKATNVFLKMEINGINIDQEYLDQFNNELIDKSKELEFSILKEFNQNFSVGSPEQLGKALERAGWPCIDRTQKGFYNTADKQLNEWKKRGYKTAETILEYRAIEKLRSSFVGSITESPVDGIVNFFADIEKENQGNVGLAKFICDDGKIHPSFGPGMTNSMRSNSNGPNFQQLPSDRTENGEKFKKVISCPDGYKKFKLDYASFQVKIAGIFSKDENIIDAFKNKSGDIHSMLAQILYCPDLTLEQFIRMKGENPYKTYRFYAKSVVFGMIFGLAATTFARTEIEPEWPIERVDEYIKLYNLKISKDENEKEDKFLTVAADIRSKFFKLFSRLEPWFEKNREFAKKNGYIDSIFGARRHLPYLMYRGKDMTTESKKKYANYLNIAINSPVQSFEAITVYKGMSKIQEQIDKLKLKSYMYGMTHDSLEGYVHESEVEIMKKILKESCEDYCTYEIPLTIDLEI